MVGIYCKSSKHVSSAGMLLSKYETRSAAVARLEETRKEYRSSGQVAEWNYYGVRELINVICKDGVRLCFFIDDV